MKVKETDWKKCKEKTGMWKSSPQLCKNISSIAGDSYDSKKRASNMWEMNIIIVRAN